MFRPPPHPRPHQLGISVLGVCAREERAEVAFGVERRAPVGEVTFSRASRQQRVKMEICCKCSYRYPRPTQTKAPQMNQTSKTWETFPQPVSRTLSDCWSACVLRPTATNAPTLIPHTSVARRLPPLTSVRSPRGHHFTPSSLELPSLQCSAVPGLNLYPNVFLSRVRILASCKQGCKEPRG